MEDAKINVLINEEKYDEVLNYLDVKVPYKEAEYFNKCLASGVAHNIEITENKIMKLLLEKRHLAPIYGERTPLASEFEDYLVIDEVPDVLHTGHVHINSHVKYKGVHMLNSGTFQKQTEFQKIYNIVPTVGQVPILSHGTFQMLDFRSD